MWGVRNMPRFSGDQFIHVLSAIFGQGSGHQNGGVPAPAWAYDVTVATGDADVVYGDGSTSVTAGTELGDDLVVGLDGDDLIVGDARGVLIGSGTAETEAGDDILFGGDGNDTIYGDFQQDPLGALVIDLGDDVIFGGAGDDVIYTDGRSIVQEAFGSNVAYGGDGDDRLYGGYGDDSLFGGAGADELHGDGFFGATGVAVAASRNLLDGGAGDDEIHGGDGADVIFGGDGIDLIFANWGDDVITAGAGADVIGWDGDFDAGDDVITDFTVGEDLIVFSFFTAHADFDALIAAAVQDGEDVVLDMGGGSTLTLQHVQLAELSAADFVF